jgi:peptidoglycan hydrolase-like protein with peptidoglycan-binding domain
VGVYQRFPVSSAGPVQKMSVAGMRRMDDVLDDFEGERLSARSALSLAAVALMAAAIFYNTIIAGTGRPVDLTGVVPAPGSTTKLVIDASDGAAGETITLRYDPVVEAVQRELAASGLYEGAVDGVAGNRTKAAIETYESRNGMEASGLATQELIEHIRYTRELSTAAEFTGSLPAPAPSEDGAGPIETSLTETDRSVGGADAPARAALEKLDRDRAASGAISEDMMDELAKLSGDSAAE